MFDSEHERFFLPNNYFEDNFCVNKSKLPGGSEWIYQIHVNTYKCSK